MTTPHPEFDALAELADREPPAAASTGAADDVALLAHVAGCARCQSELAGLRQVRATLRALPAVTMPADVAARLEAAISAEASRAAGAAETPRAAAGAAEGAASPVSVLPTGRAHDSAVGRRRALPHFSAAASVAVLLVVALGVAIGYAASHSTESKKSASTASSSVSGPVIVASGTAYSTGAIRDQVSAKLLQLVPGAAAHYALDQQSKAAAAPASAPAAAGAAAASASSPASAVPSSSSSPLTASAPSPARTAPSGPLANPTTLQSCVNTLAGRPAQPVLVDYASFDGAPATVIVLPDPDTKGKLDVFVVKDSASCEIFSYETFIG